MPLPLTYPGVYVEELPSGARAITGVATSVAAFVGRAWRGPTDAPTLVSSYAEFERSFGGLWRASTLGYAVQQFFLNGGGQALIVRVAKSATPATFSGFDNGLTFKAASPGSWGMNLQVSIDSTNTKDPNDKSLFHLTVIDDKSTIRDAQLKGGNGASEKFLNVSVNPDNPRFVDKVLKQQSQLLQVAVASTDKVNAPTGKTVGADPIPPAPPGSGVDGDAIDDGAILGNDGVDNPTGVYSLRKADLFNLLCIPPLVPGPSGIGKDVEVATWLKAAKLCFDRRALLLVDAPITWTVTSVTPTAMAAYSNPYRDHSAIYFPRLLMTDPLQDGKLESFAPCGVMAGVMSRTDAARGVWKAPAGMEAGLAGVLGLSINDAQGTLTDSDVGSLNPLGVNSLRNFPVIGHVAWGARTMDGADVLASQWKYIPVRRLALFIEESLFRGTQWVVFEPNDEPLWAQIRLNVGAFMQTLFQQGAFQGSSPKDAYFVKCSSETTTQADIDNGIVNVLVGFAPLKPAEFVVIQIQQISPQS